MRRRVARPATRRCRRPPVVGCRHLSWASWIGAPGRVVAVARWLDRVPHSAEPWCATWEGDELMSDSGKDAIEAVRAQFPVLFNEGKFDELGEWFYAEDAMALPAGQEPIRGRAAICAFFADLWANAGLRFDLGVIQTVADDDIGYLVGTYVARTPGGSVPGVTHEAYRRQPDGSWKCHVDMWHDSVQ